MEMRMCVAEVISRYNLRFADGFNPDVFMDEVKDCMSWHLNELPLIFDAV